MGKSKHNSRKANKTSNSAPRSQHSPGKSIAKTAKVSKKTPEKITKKSSNAGRKDMSKMSVEDFFNGGFENDSSEDEQITHKVDEEALDKATNEELYTLNELEQVEVSASDDSDEEDIASINGDIDDSDEEIMENIEEDKDENENEEEQSEEEEVDKGKADIDEDEESDDDDEEDGKEEKEEDEEDEDEENDVDSGEKLKKDVAKHRKELEELKKRDPEFYKYLEKEETGLLDFDMSDDDLDGSDNEGENDEEDNEEDLDMEDVDMTESEEEQEEAIKEEPASEVLTKKKVSDWVKQVEETQSLKAMKRLLAAFKTAARMSDEEQEEKTTFVYTIDDPSVLNNVIVSTLRQAPIVFNRHITPRHTGGSPTTASRWPFLQPIVKSYLQNMLHLLRNLTDSNMLYLAVKESEKCTAYWACFERPAKEYLKILLDLWSNATSTDHVRIQCFLAIRSLAVTPVTAKKGLTNFLDVCLKNVYLTFVRNCKTTNQHTLPAINLMRNLAVELYGINQDLSYQQAFIYIRQLAIHLRGAMQLKTKVLSHIMLNGIKYLAQESYKTVYNWQYIHCVDFWANVLATHCQHRENGDESPLKPLIYPLVQVALGAIRLIPTGQYFPLRFHIIRCLISLNQSTEVYIPLAPYIIEVFESSEVKGKAKPSTLKPLEWEVHLKAPQQYLHGRVYQDGILEQVHDCLLSYYQTYFHHIAFPEIVIPGIVATKRFIKKTKNIKGARQLHNLVQKASYQSYSEVALLTKLQLEKKARFIEIERSKVDFSPIDTEKVKGFMITTRSKLQ
ncbi:Nucleolar Complex 2 protein [Apophysomyces ossiformis]|uniref:Nucleolar Complex 2 protein n=1 Tax=Apophysomyces ossiformis TaxID=679940 RepID=A0A8H7EV44_9FUNG|nr:Nucleolar Complex 2 protein [Apophysomyces ossiformis]